MRMMLDEENSDELNSLFESISQVKDGSYLIAQTASEGFGQQVSLEAMRKLWIAYEVGQKGLQLLGREGPRVSGLRG